MALSFAEEYELMMARRTVNEAKLSLWWHQRREKGFWAWLFSCDPADSYVPYPVPPEHVHAAEQTVVRLELKAKPP